MAKQENKRLRTRLSLRSNGEKILISRRHKDQIKREILELLNQWPIEELETEFLSKNEKDPKEDFLIYKKNIDKKTDTQKICPIEDKKTNYLLGQSSYKKESIYYLIDIWELVEILGKKKIMMINRNIKILITKTLQKEKD